ncbi:MAG: hypothetical protein AB8F95_19225 [Bacteroidia bacterium]
MNARNILGLIWSLIEAKPYRWLMLLFVMLEIGLITVYQNHFGWYWSPAIFTLSSLAIGIIPLYISTRDKSLANSGAHLAGSANVRLILIAAVGLIGAFYTLSWMLPIWEAHPIKVSESDVIPSVQLFAQRLMGGADGLPVYAPYDGFGYRLDPTYLPFQWLPFVISEKLGVDPRWVPIGTWLIGQAFFLAYLVKRKLSIVWTLLIAALPFIILELINRAQPNMLYQTIELMDVGYYMFLGWSLLRGGLAAKGVGFILTLLSRFSHIFWAPFYFLGLFLTNQKAKSIKLGVMILLGIILVYIVPFLSQDWESFTRGQGHYTRAALGAWSISWDDSPIPSDLRHGAGLAIFFFQGDEVPLEDQINTLRTLHLGFSIGMALLVGLGYLFYFKHRLQAEYYFLFGLKIYFAIFYGFIQVPYTYLYQVPVFLSLLVLVAAGGGRLLRK